MIQAAMSTQDTFNGLIRIIEILILPLLWKIYTTLSEINEKQAMQTGEINTVKTILIGTDGKNGIRSRVRRLEKRQEHTALLLAKHLEQVPPLEADEEEDE